MALGVALPWIGNIVYVFKLGPWPGVNWLGVSVIGSGLVFAWLAVREGLFDVLPAAREAIIALMPEGVLVVDDHGQILLANPAARVQLRLVEGGRAPDALLEALAILPRGDRSAAPVEMTLGTAEEPSWLEVHRGDVHDRWGDRVAHLIVVRDITRRKQVEYERETLIADLSAALGRIQSLEGLLRICAHCKQIRDDAGAWSPLESYFASHSNLAFTHGICPDCSRDFLTSVSAE